MPDIAMEWLRRQFTILDSNFDSVLERHDFDILTKRVLAAVNEAPDSAKSRMFASATRLYWEGLHAHAHAHGDGIVTFPVYLAVVRDAANYERFVRYYVKAQAAVCDLNDDGVIDRAEMLACLDLVGFDEPGAQALFSTWPCDTTGVTQTTWIDAIGAYYLTPAANSSDVLLDSR